MTNNKKISFEVMKELSSQKGEPVSRAAENAGVSKPIISYWKNGRSEPNLNTLHKLSVYFGVPIETFFKENANA